MAKDKVYSKLDTLPKGRGKDLLIPGCLCLEGGAFRGVYTSGVLDALNEADFNFETTIGVSAGSLTGLTYVSGQIGKSGYLNLKYRHDPNYVGPLAIIKDGSVIGFDYMFNGKAGKDMNVDTDYLQKTTRKFYAVVTNVHTGLAEYKEMHDYPIDQFYQVLRASSSMPLFSKMVRLDGSYYLDGGCACKVPYSFALEKGYKKIIVVRTRERSFTKEPISNNEKTLYRLRYGKHKAFYETLCNANDMYNHQIKELQKLEEEGRIFVIAPSQPVTVGRIESDMEKLGDFYWLGYNDAKASFEKLREYLAK